MSGRLDFLAGLLAVQDRPFIGHGSWAQDVVGYRYRAAVIAGMPYYEYEKGSFGRLNGHSNVLEAWTEHGLAALPFWLMMMFIMFQCVNRCFNVHCHFVGPLTFLLFTRLWDFFFSPIVARTTLSFAFALFIIVSLKVQSTKIKAGTSRWRGQRIFRKALS
jgi:O-antigen ligase